MDEGAWTSWGLRAAARGSVSSRAACPRASFILCVSLPTLTSCNLGFPGTMTEQQSPPEQMATGEGAGERGGNYKVYWGELGCTGDKWAWLDAGGMWCACSRLEPVPAVQVLLGTGVASNSPTAARGGGPALVLSPGGMQVGKQLGMGICCCLAGGTLLPAKD